MSLHPTDHTTTTSAIFKLDDDSLLSIFDTITSQIPERLTPQHIRPLTIVRAASQVCRRWRGLLLASPWIWGRLVDLDVESHIHIPQNVEWLQEVVRRTGKLAPLWIYGRVLKSALDLWTSGDDMNPSESHALDIESNFIRLLESWERIERLSVYIESDRKETLSRIQDRFLRRAPTLTVFDVQFSSVDDPLFLDTLLPGSSKCLFADYAPLLRTIKAEQVCYKFNSPWLSGIREIDPLPHNLTLQDMFILFQHTPMLERIGLDGDNLSWTDHHQTHPPFPRLVLPNLSSIKLWSGLSGFARILDHISPGRLSSLLIKVWDYQTTHLDGSPIPSSVKTSLPSYISSYFTTNTLRCVQLSVTRRRFRLFDVSSVVHDDALPKFEVMIEAYMLSHQHDWDIIITSLLDAFTEALRRDPSTLRSVTELRLPRIEVQPTLIPKVYSTLALFHNVRHIQTDERFLRALSSLYKESGNDPQYILFPDLHTLRLNTLNSQNTCTDLIPFIMMRKSAGFPVAHLDLTRCGDSWKHADALCNLEAVHGLELVWRKGGPEKYEEEPEICSHICGSGDPQRLKNLILS